MKAGELIQDTGPIKPGQLSIRQQVKKDREKDINKMGSMAILWHVTRRHRVGLLMTTNLAFIAYLVIARVGV